MLLALNAADADPVEVADAFAASHNEIDTTAPATEAERFFDEREAQLERELSNAFLEQKRIESQLKMVKKNVDWLGKELREHREAGIQELPLFDQAATLDTSDSAGVDVDPEAWRTVPLTKTTIPKGLLTILAECPDVQILTIGHLADWTASKPLTEIPRIGKGKAEIIEAAMEKFWATHQTG